MSGHALVDIQNTFGCTFIGLIISILLFGITVGQTWIYFWGYAKRDPTLLKLFILIIIFLDAFHTILSIYAVYWYLILNFGNVENLGYNMWAMNLQINITGVLDYLVQLYYARRAYLLSNSLVIPAIIALLGANYLAMGFLFTVRTAVLKTWSSYTSLVPVVCIGLGSGVLADALIAFSMCWYLYHKRTGFARTDSMIMTLMRYSINSGLLICILITGVLISFSIQPSSMIWQIFYWPMAKIYANSLLAMLNSRDHIREQPATDEAENPFKLFIRAKGGAVNEPSSNLHTLSFRVQPLEATDLPEINHDHYVESGITTKENQSRPSRYTL